MIQDMVVGLWELALSVVHAFRIAAFRLAWESIVDIAVDQDHSLGPRVEILFALLHAGVR
jgi:hypothetical protein